MFPSKAAVKKVKKKYINLDRKIKRSLEAMASIDPDEVITVENAEEKCKANDLMIDLNTNLLQKYRHIKGI